MHEQEKNLQTDDARRKRIDRMKKVIVALVLTLVIVPCVLCTILIFRICYLNNQVDDLLGKNEETTVTANQVTTENKSDADSTETQSENSTDSGEATVDSTEETAPTETESVTQETTTVAPPTTSVITDPLPSGKYAYLTFDDGPSENTFKILDILDQYNVKATFFVNGHTGATMEERYKAIVDRGHAIGIHTFSHQWDSVYGGLESFENEVVSLREYIKKVTGKDTNLFRFPGGTSNSRVDDIYPYITWITEHGYQYWDWNSSSGDASGQKLTAAQIVSNSMIQANEGYSNLVILMHDTASKGTTVEALPALIEALKAKGYEIRAIDERSTPVQHRKLK